MTNDHIYHVYVHRYVALYSPKIESSKQHIVMETVMNKLIIGLMIIFFVGDPGMETSAWLDDAKNYVITAAIALASRPFIVSQLDG